MKEPMIIGGKSNSPGPKVLKKIRKTTLSKEQVITHASQITEEFVTREEKEKIEKLNFKSDKIVTSNFIEFNINRDKKR